VLGATGKAKAYYERLAAIPDNGNTDRPELALARQFLAKN
jgi:hypothetical protein